MPPVLDPETRRAIADRIRYYNELGIYDFYQRQSAVSETTPSEISETAITEPMTPRTKAAPQSLRRSAYPMDQNPSQSFPIPSLRCGPSAKTSETAPAAGSSKQGRKQIVFGVGNPQCGLNVHRRSSGRGRRRAGRAIRGPRRATAHQHDQSHGPEPRGGLHRQHHQVPSAGKPHSPSATNAKPARHFSCGKLPSIKPKAIVALGAVAAKTLLAINAPMSELRGRWYDFRGTKLAVTYHPAFLLRDPRQKKETWKDLQMVMKELGMEAPAKGGE